MGVIPFKRPDKSKEVAREENQREPHKPKSWVTDKEHPLFQTFDLGKKLLDAQLTPEVRKELDREILCAKIQLHINKLEGYRPTIETLRIRRKILEKPNLGQLELMLFESKEKDWTKMPSFFKALIDEIRSRPR
jgi:hypothetical protein